MLRKMMEAQTHAIAHLVARTNLLTESITQLNALLVADEEEQEERDLDGNISAARDRHPTSLDDVGGGGG